MNDMNDWNSLDEMLPVALSNHVQQEAVLQEQKDAAEEKRLNLIAVTAVKWTNAVLDAMPEILHEWIDDEAFPELTANQELKKWPWLVEVTIAHPNMVPIIITLKQVLNDARQYGYELNSIYISEYRIMAPDSWYSDAWLKLETKPAYILSDPARDLFQAIGAAAAEKRLELSLQAKVNELNQERLAYRESMSDDEDEVAAAVEEKEKTRRQELEQVIDDPVKVALLDLFSAIEEDRAGWQALLDEYHGV